MTNLEAANQRIGVLKNLILSLTDEEVFLFELIALEDRNNKQIASLCNVSVRTVENRRQGLYRKLNVTSPAALGRIYGEWTMHYKHLRHDAPHHTWALCEVVPPPTPTTPQ